MTHKQSFSFLTLTNTNLAQESYKHGWKTEFKKNQRSVVVEERPPPFCVVSHTGKEALLMAGVGPLCRQVEMEGIIAQAAFLLRGCWDLISVE